MRPDGTPSQLEKRRRRAMRLLDEGLSLNAVARKLGCHASSVMRWRDDRVKFGDEGLKPKPASGRPPKLSGAEKARLIKMLLKGAMAHGWQTELWTTARIAQLIDEKFGVVYHRDHIGRLMGSLGWTHQKPEKRALERNEAATHEWKRHQWPKVKKTPSGWAPISFSSTNRDSS